MKFSPLQLNQSHKWPYSYVLVNNDVRADIVLAVISSADSLADANKRPENVLLNKYLKLITAAPKMLDLLTKLADGYEWPIAMSGDNVYDSRDALLRETDHYSYLVDEAAALLNEIKGGED